MTSGPADSLATRDFAQALQTVADSVRIVAGFEVAAISVLRPDQRFEYVVISATHEGAEDFLGRGNALSVVEEQNRNALRWGRFDFVPHDAQDEIDGEATWTPKVEYPESEDAFHPDDLLSTLLRDDDGQIIGMLSLDVPVNGRRPDGRQLALMEAFADHTERVLRQVQAQHALTARLRLADAAREVVRRASSSVTLEEVLSDCLPALVTGFDLRGLWVQVFSEDPGGGTIAAAEGMEIEVPPRLMALAEYAAGLAWEEQTVTVLTATSILQFISEDQRGEVVEFLDSIGVASLLFVPLGAGERALGNLVLTRAPTAESEWTEAEKAAALELGRDLGQALHNAQLFAHNRDLVRQLQDLADYKRTLVDMMVHELKNPLTAIAGYVEMARAEEGIAPFVGQAFDAIDRSTGRLRELVDSLLTLSKVNERADGHGDGPVDLVPALACVIDFLRVKADAKQLHLSVDSSDAAVVRGDTEMLELVFSNLINNAIKYTPEGGRVQVTLTPDGDEVVLRVEDTGLGISSDDQAHIFEEFRRSTNPVATAIPGTGLGLAIVARVVEQHRGRVSVDSTLGAGSTFEVRLPVGQVPQQ